MTDTAGYTDVIFGLFLLLGYQFSPRLADAGGARFWRLDRSPTTGRSTSSPATASTRP
jgi:TnpA family transposase